MSDDLVTAWRTAHAITLRFLAGVADDALHDRYAPRTRTVAEQFQHIHYVRVKHLEARGRAHLGDLAPFAKGATPSRRELTAALEASGEALARLFAEIAASGEVRSWSGSPPATYLAYHVAHEAYHRALASVALRAGGHRAPAEITQNLWYLWRKGAGDAAT